MSVVLQQSHHMSTFGSNESWCDDMETNKPETQYIFGFVNDQRHSFPTLVVATPMSNGWKCRSTCKNMLNHDYVTGETFSDVMGWLDMEMNRPFIACDREEVLKLLGSDDETSSCHRTGFLYPDNQLVPSEAAEQVLQHLENDW